MNNCIGFTGTGFIIGILSGLFGVGGGFLLVPYNIAIGSILLQMVGTSAASSLKHRGYGNIDFRLVACILTGSIIGSQLGARIHNNIRGAYVRYYFSLLIFFTAGIILIKFLFIIGCL